MKKQKEWKQTKFGDYEMEVSFPVYHDTHIHVVITKDIHASQQARGRECECGEHHNGQGLFQPGYDGDCPFIFMNHGQFTAGGVAHESFHCVEHICDMIGADFRGEHSAYMVGYLSDAIFEFVLQNHLFGRQ